MGFLKGTAASLGVMVLLMITFSAKAETLSKYTLVEDFSGKDFFSHFNFATFDDPTHGFVEYVRESRAHYLGLLAINPTSGQVRISVDSKSPAYGRGRPAVRITSKSTFNTGLFIIDVAHLPEGNAVWPAFWSFGPNWPASGEIDVIEGKNDQPYNQSTLHTTPGCVMPSPSSGLMTGRFSESLDCNYVDGYKGCTTQGPDGSFSTGFNKAGGGVYALLWTETSMSVWFFSRQSIPLNISSGAPPDPSQWGLPTSYFQLGPNCPSSHFKNQNLVINTTFCGDWAGRSFNGPTGHGLDACNAYVSHNPKEFVNAYWQINSLRAYQTQSP